MRVLALDTSSAWTSCALVDTATGIVAEAFEEPPRKAGELLPRMLVDLCGGDFSHVDGLAVGMGPGSFTGLRVGLAAVKALAYARKLPLAGASSLLALALGTRTEGLVVATLEARRGELYACAVEGSTVIVADTVLAAARLPSFVEALGRPATVVGPGARANAAALGGLCIAEKPTAPLARDIASLCAECLQGRTYDQDAVFALAPNYLQPSAAEVALAEGRVGGLPR
jgi:tRNA threonylcarbamoyladenosine biosynthesis protein TsaB